MANQNNRGRTPWDLIAENKTHTFVIVIILFLGLVLIVANGYTFKSNYFSLEPDVNLKGKNVVVLDTTSVSKKEIAKAPFSKKEEDSKFKSTQEIKKPIKEKKESITQPTINVTSNNQSGGITANQVNIGSVPRNLDENFKRQLLEALTIKSEKIDIASVMGDSESFRFANQINDFLKSQGYINVEGVSQAVYSKPVIGQFIDRDKIGVKITIGSKSD